MITVADGDWFISPDLGAGACTATSTQCTVFERFSIGDWMLTATQEKTSTGLIEGGVASALNGLANGIGYIGHALAYGSISMMQWVLGLGGLYADSSTRINAAVSTVGGSVFWPFAGVSVAVGTVILVVQRAWGALITMLCIAVVAMGMIMAPAAIADGLDGARSSVSDKVMTGYSNAATGGTSAAGFPTPNLPADHNGAVRRVSDSLWNTFVVAPWCMAEFGSMATCKALGQDVMLPHDPSVWSQAVLLQLPNGPFGDSCDPRVATTRAQCDQVRGLSAARLGAVLFGLLVTIPLALILMALELFLLLALLTFMVLLLLSPIFLVLWIVPGRCRSIGWKWWEWLLGAVLSAVMVTALIGVVMALSAVLAAGTERFGPGSVAVITGALMWVALKVRTMVDTNMLGHPAGGGLNPYVGMKLASLAMGRARAAGNSVKGLGRTGVRAAGAGVNQVMNPQSATSRAARGARFQMARLRQETQNGARGFVPPPMQASDMYAATGRPGGGGTNRQITAGSHAPAPSAPPRTFPAKAAGGRTSTPGYLGDPGLGGPQRATPSAPGQEPPALPPAPKPKELTARATSTAGLADGTPLNPGAPAPQSEQRGHRQLGPESRKPQDPARVFATHQAEPGAIYAVRRRIVQPSRRNSLTPPGAPPRHQEVVSWGQGKNVHATTRQMAPLRPRKDTP